MKNLISAIENGRRLTEIADAEFEAEQLHRIERRHRRREQAERIADAMIRRMLAEEFGI